MYKIKKFFATKEERSKWIEILSKYAKSTFHDKYLMLENIGIGGFSTVFKGIKVNIFINFKTKL